LRQRRGAEKSPGRGRGCVFGSSPKRLEWFHPELVHWCLLVHSRPYATLISDNDSHQFS